MKIKKFIKKIVAIGTGTLMLGATLLGAGATTLSDYPTPFIKDGQFNSVLVVGDTALPSDIIGAIDVAASLQYNMKQTTNIIIDSDTTTSIEGGKKIETSGAKLRQDDVISDVLTTILPEDLQTVLVKEGTLTADGGTEYTYKTSIKTPNSKIQFGEPGDEESPIVYMDFGNNVKYTLIIEFPKAVNMTELIDEKISLFGTDYTISGKESELSGSKLTLYGGAMDQTFTAGDTTTIGGDIVIEVVGVNTQSEEATAMLKINTESKTVKAGKSYTIGGVDIYVKDVFAYTAPITNGAVRLYIGSNELVLNDGDSVESNNNDIDGTEVTFTSSAGKVSKIEIDVIPYEFDDEIEYIPVDDEGIVDAVFGTFKIALTGVNPELDSDSRELIQVSPSSNKVKVKWTNKNDVEYNMDMFYEDGGIVKLGNRDTKDIVVDNGKSVLEDDYFIVSTDGYSHILQLTDVDDDLKEITVKDSGESYTFSHNGTNGDVTFDGYTYPFVVIGTGTSAKIDVTSGLTNTVVTEEGAVLTFVENWCDVGTPPVCVNGEPNPIGAYTYESALIIFNELSIYNDETTSIEDDYANSYNISIEYNSEMEIEISVDNAYSIGDGDNYLALTLYGTAVEYGKNDEKIVLSYNSEATTYDVFMAPTDAVTTVIGGDNTYTTENIQKISVGMAMLASEISDIKAQNLITVGGPCVNTISASLLGNPSNCADGFNEGSAIIKLFEHANGNVAIMIAGYSADDTRRATRVVADFDKYDEFVDTEIEVSGTTMSDISIGAPMAEDISVINDTAVTNTTNTTG